MATALIVVDVQRDFLPGGPVPVAGGDQVVPLLNDYIREFTACDLPVFATRDWHPPNHCSFKENGGIWERHCVAGEPGADSAPGLELPADVAVISKGTNPAKDAYSGFQGTSLHAQLQQGRVRRVFVGGLATDYCVKHTVRDALKRGYQVVLLLDAVRAAEVKFGDGALAVADMLGWGAKWVRWESPPPGGPSEMAQVRLATRVPPDDPRPGRQRSTDRPVPVHHGAGLPRSGPDPGGGL